MSVNAVGADDDNDDDRDVADDDNDNVIITIIIIILIISGEFSMAKKTFMIMAMPVNLSLQAGSSPLNLNP